MMNRRQNQMCNNITRQQQCRAQHMAAKSPMTGGRMRAEEDAPPVVGKTVIFDETTKVCRPFTDKEILIDGLMGGTYATLDACVNDNILTLDATMTEGCNCKPSNTYGGSMTGLRCMASQPVCYQKALDSSAKALDASNKQVISSNKALADSKANEGCSKDERKKLTMWYWVIILIAVAILIGLAVVFWHFNKKLQNEIKLYKPPPPPSLPGTSLPGINQ